MDIINFLLERGAVVNCKDNIGSTPLLQAASRGHLSVVNTLIDRGAEVNCKDMNLDTPLHKAAGKGHIHVVNTLIDVGADVNCKDIVSHCDWCVDIVSALCVRIS
eukprot:GHVR01092155.1.p1 GENE.GHVR01092155.1~~GHVR01092155.1.p1  ORF type:complete len:105 (+),score=18.64 GHVR01092155.1:99-413(+)